MTRSLQMFLAGATLLASAVPAMAGGLFVILGNPRANSQAHLMGAVLTLKLAGCHEPEKAEVSAAAIGSQDGHRQAIPLKLIKLNEPGTYAVMPQWPSKGRWVLQFIAKENGLIASTLVASGPGGIEREAARVATKLPSESDIAALLAGTSKPDVARR